MDTSKENNSDLRMSSRFLASFASAAETEATTTAADSSILVTQQQLLRQQQGTQQMIPPNLRPYEAGVCARKMMMYLYHLQQRPAENCITYWKKFVAEYFSPHAKQRLCLSQYENAGHHALGMFPQAAPVSLLLAACGP
uniref:Uncharacterized protein n=1 Tax=Brassica campestris TaxID=3711 RepID=A0A3P5ZRZ2_BRACM|nr:unnamed protein product [Brassica rapa]